MYKLCEMYIQWLYITSTVLEGKLTTEHPYNKSYLFPSPNSRFGSLQTRKGINNLMIPISLFRLCSHIHLFPNISYSRFYICTACFTQTSQLPHWLVPELEMRPANQTAARLKYLNNCTLYFCSSAKNIHRTLRIVVVPATILQNLITFYGLLKFIKQINPKQGSHLRISRF